LKVKEKKVNKVVYRSKGEIFGIRGVIKKYGECLNIKKKLLQ